MRDCPKWVLLNAGGMGYYRSSYTREQLAKVLAAPPRDFTVEERLALLADVEGSVRRGDLPLGEALRLVPATANDAERTIVQRGARLLQLVNEDGLSEAERARFRKWVGDIYAPRARKLGWEPKPGDSDETKQERSRLMELATMHGEDPALSQEAERLARAWLKDRSSVDPEAVNGVLVVAAMHGDKALFDTLLTQARKEEDRNERSRLLTALATFRDPALVKEGLSLVAGTEMDLRDTKVLLTGAFSNPETRELAWAFYREHFDALAERLKSDDFDWLVGLVDTLCDSQHHAEVQAFLKPRVSNLESAPRALARAEESIRLCAESDRLHRDGVKSFLRSPPTVPASTRTR
jgi:aminopeptidase N